MVTEITKYLGKLLYVRWAFICWAEIAYHLPARQEANIKFIVDDG